MMSLSPDRPAVALIARPLPDGGDGADLGATLPLVGNPLPVPPGQVGLYVSEAMVDLHGARLGSVFAPLSASFKPLALAENSPGALKLFKSIC